MQDNNNKSYFILNNGKKIEVPSGAKYNSLSNRKLTTEQRKFTEAVVNQIAQFQAYELYKFWLVQLNKDIRLLQKALNAKTLARYSNKILSQSISLRIERYTDLMFSDAYHLYKSLGNANFIPPLKSDLEKVLKSDLFNTVKHLRNLREHWEDNRDYLKDSSSSKLWPSAGWFKKNFSDKSPHINPWSMVYRSGHEPLVAGVFKVSLLQK